jgi:hypothetical protein
VKTDLETEIEKEGVGTGHVTEREDDKSVIDPDVLLSAALPKRRGGMRRSNLPHRKSAENRSHLLVDCNCLSQRNEIRARLYSQKISK